MSGQIFISYRRDDSAASAGRLYDRLTTRFPSSKLFIDVDNLDAGVDFVEAIEQNVGSCDVLIAVIGKRWLTSSDEEGRRRLDNAEDFVRLEIATALKRGVRVIPVLVDGASMPPSGELPEDLKALARRHALQVSHDRFNADSERLIGAVKRVVSPPRTEEPFITKKHPTEQERNIPPPEKSAAPGAADAATAIDSGASRASDRESSRDASSRLGPSEAGPLEDAEGDPTARKESERELPRKEAIPLPSPKEELPFLQTPKGRAILAVASVLVIVVLALAVIPNESREKKQEPFASPTATPVAFGSRAPPADSLNTAPVTVAPVTSPTPYRPPDILDPKWGSPPRAVDLIGEQPVMNANAESTPRVANRAQVVSVTTPASLPGSVGAATKEKPFVNSLGMKFVPVPGTNVLLSVWETQVKDYQAFCGATGRSWEKTGFSQTGDHPAVNVSWEDATAFCEWLSQKEGNKYRLPTDHEWSCAVGIGDREDAAATPKSKGMKIDDVFPWGGQWPPPNDAGNYFGEECKAPAGLAALKATGNDPSNWTVIEGFNDGTVFTAAVGSFRPNELGIYDLGGNVWEWCQDKYESESALRVLRGGSWSTFNRVFLLSSYRHLFDPDVRYDVIGFRVVVEAGFGR